MWYPDIWFTPLEETTSTPSLPCKFHMSVSGADPEFFLGGGALVSCSTSTPINHIVFFLQNTSCIRKPQVISGGGGGGIAQTDTFLLLPIYENRDNFTRGKENTQIEVE